MSQERPWGRGGWQGRPPWWPEGEPFPPPEWRRRQGHVFRRRYIFFFFLAFLMFALVMSFLVFVLFQGFSALAGGPPHPLFIVLAALFVFFALTGGVRGATRIARPVGDLIGAADRIKEGDYSARVRERGPREVRSLASAFNAMSERLGQSETERRRLLADITHELRTPLTVIQGNLEALIDGVHPADEAHFRAILDETRVLSRLIDDLRTISVAEAGALALHREPTDLPDLVRDVVASFGPTASQQGVTIRVDAPPSTAADVDPIRVREILSNVLANALRYTPRGGEIRVAVTATEREATISVHDSGPGIDPDVLPHVFERFTKSSTSPGAGLGLAIAKSLVAAHGGVIEALSTSGTGTEIRFTLPNPAP
jgi:signal transduction histidine kinase